MGHVCVGSSKDKYSLENILSDKMKEPKDIKSKYPINDYIKKAFCLINRVRLNPSEFVFIIETSKKYVKELNGRKIFDDNKIKVSLNEGKIMFQDCANYLKTLQPMEELIFCDDIVLECPKDEQNIKGINFFKQKLLEKKENFGIEAYFKDSIRFPEISVLLMLVDDSSKNPRKKREALLNPKYKYIGISTSDINDDKNENQKNNNINGYNNKNKNSNNIDKIIKSEIKHNPFCAYFTLK